MKAVICSISLMMIWACIEDAGTSTDDGGADSGGGLDGSAGDGSPRDGSPLDATARPDAALADAFVPPACPEITTSLECAQYGCNWWRAPGEQARCRDETRPTDCDQPDEATCAAAGCEWTGNGCAPSLETACLALDQALCAGRPDCMEVDQGCVPRSDVACQELAREDCQSRQDCGWLGASCAELDQRPCPQLGQWACTERRDCAPVVVPGCDQQPKAAPARPFAPDAGTGDQAPPPECAAPSDCPDGAGCYSGSCHGCGDFVGCGPLN